MLPYTEDDWSRHLQRTKRFGPFHHLEAMCPAVSANIRQATACLHGTTQDLWSSWTDPELIWLAKPNKPPDKPANLRLIGLIRPDGKALAGLLKESLMPYLHRYLGSTPQFAYLPGRDLFDAVARVRARLALVTRALTQVGGNRFTIRARREAASMTSVGRHRTLVAGGAVLSVDLSKAFDTVCRGSGCGPWSHCSH